MIKSKFYTLQAHDSIIFLNINVLKHFNLWQLSVFKPGMTVFGDSAYMVIAD